MHNSSKSEYVPALSYNWLTPLYDAVVATTTRERTFKHALIDQADIKAGQQVLDLACGTGTLTIWSSRASRWPPSGASMATLESLPLQGVKPTRPTSTFSSIARCLSACPIPRHISIACYPVCFSTT